MYHEILSLILHSSLESGLHIIYIPHILHVMQYITFELLQLMCVAMLVVCVTMLVVQNVMAPIFFQDFAIFAECFLSEVEPSFLRWGRS